MIPGMKPGLPRPRRLYVLRYVDPQTKEKRYLRADGESTTIVGRAKTYGTQHEGETDRETLNSAWKSMAKVVPLIDEAARCA